MVDSPHTNARPITSRRFPDTPNQAGLDKVDEEGLVSGSATLDASKIRRTAIMSSAAFPNVAFSNPPSDSVVLNAISSVALPMRNARGMIAIREEKNARSGPDLRS